MEDGDEPRAETESESEEELSCFATTVRTRSWKHTHNVTSCETVSSSTVGLMNVSSLMGSFQVWMSDPLCLFPLLHEDVTVTYFGFIAKVDVKTTALAMAITDSELSDEEASILESGGFSVSRATTPQLADLSEGKYHSCQGDTGNPASTEITFLLRREDQRLGSVQPWDQ